MHTHPLKDRDSYIVETKLGQGELRESQELGHEEGTWERDLQTLAERPAQAIGFKI